METEAKPALPKTREQLQAEVEGLRESLARAEKLQVHYSKLAREHENSLADARKIIDELKDELHRATVTIARLEGYRERVEQFDPVPERVLHKIEERERALHPAYTVDGYAVTPGPKLRREGRPWYRRG